MRFPVARSLRLLHVPLFLFLLAEREADPGLSWVTFDIRRVEHWRGREMSVEAILQAGLLVGLLWSLGTLLLYGLPAGLAAVSRRPAWARALLLATLGVSVLAEEGSSTAPATLKLVEETAELIVAAALLASVVLAGRAAAR